MTKILETKAFGLEKGEASIPQIKTNLNDFQNLHSIYLYINARRPPEYYWDLLKMRPKKSLVYAGELKL